MSEYNLNYLSEFLFLHLSHSYVNHLLLQKLDFFCVCRSAQRKPFVTLLSVSLCPECGSDAKHGNASASRTQDSGNISFLLTNSPHLTLTSCSFTCRHVGVQDDCRFAWKSFGTRAVPQVVSPLGSLVVGVLFFLLLFFSSIDIINFNEEKNKLHIYVYWIFMNSRAWLCTPSLLQMCCSLWYISWVKVPASIFLKSRFSKHRELFDPFVCMWVRLYDHFSIY